MDRKSLDRWASKSGRSHPRSERPPAPAPPSYQQPYQMPPPPGAAPPGYAWTWAGTTWALVPVGPPQGGAQLPPPVYTYPGSGMPAHVAPGGAPPSYAPPRPPQTDMLVKPGRNPYDELLATLPELQVRGPDGNMVNTYAYDAMEGRPSPESQRALEEFYANPGSAAAPPRIQPGERLFVPRTPVGAGPTHGPRGE